jgi:hypothetical protein
MQKSYALLNLILYNFLYETNITWKTFYERLSYVCCLFLL